jgi:hypothetical protein
MTGRRHVESAQLLFLKIFSEKSSEDQVRDWTEIRHGADQALGSALEMVISE